MDVTDFACSMLSMERRAEFDTVQSEGSDV